MKCTTIKAPYSYYGVSVNVGRYGVLLQIGDQYSQTRIVLNAEEVDALIANLQEEKKKLDNKVS